MKRLFSLIIGIAFISQTLSGVMAQSMLDYSSSPFLVAQNQASRITPGRTRTLDEQASPLTEYFAEAGDNLANEVVFDNIAAVAGPSCSLYALGLDFKSFFWDGAWSLLEPILSITVLFRNEAWRNLIWALEDEREVLMSQISALEKKKCLLLFALGKPELRQFFLENDAPDVTAEFRIRKQMARLDFELDILHQRRDYFGLQRRKLLLDVDPVFFEVAVSQEGVFTSRRLPTDKMFYFVGGMTFLEVNYDEFLTESENFVADTWVDLQTLAEGFSDTCYTAVNLLDELFLNFVYLNSAGTATVSGDNSVNIDVQSFKEFVETNRSAVRTQYLEACEKQDPNVYPPPGSTGADAQFERFKKVQIANLKQFNLFLKKNDEVIVSFLKTSDERELTQAEQSVLLALRNMRSVVVSMRDYTILLQKQIGALSPVTDLEKLRKRLSSMSEAILGLQRNKDGSVSSRLNLSKRFEKSEEKTYQKLCARMAALYSKAGRNPAYLPIIGHANGKTYCRPTPAPGLGLGEGIVEGFSLVGRVVSSSALAVASAAVRFYSAFEEGFEFGDISISGFRFGFSDDLGGLLEQRAFNDLIVSRTLHFRSLRSRYKSRFQSSAFVTSSLERVIDDASTDLYDPDLEPQVYEPDKKKKGYHSTHYGLMRKIYQDMWLFQSRVGESCPAPKDPVD